MAASLMHVQPHALKSTAISGVGQFLWAQLYSVVNTWCEDDAWEWGQKLYGWGCELAVVKVSLPGMKLASQQQCDEMAQEVTRWARAEGYLHLAENGKYDPTEKMEQLYQNSPEFSNP